MVWPFRSQILIIADRGSFRERLGFPLGAVIGRRVLGIAVTYTVWKRWIMGGRIIEDGKSICFSARRPLPNTREGR